MFKTIRVLVLLGLILALSTAIRVQAASPTVVIVTAEGIINPVLADYIARGIEEAEDMNATACIIQMDTPGGLDTAMRDIVQEIVNARIPVVVYVSPAGARAASAGAFITIAAHVAVMAPSTAIGAASPVSVSSEGEVEMSETMQEKVMNDAAALIRGLAETHGRNVEWAEKAVREAESANEREALELNVIDIIAADIDDLISKLDGWEVTLLGGAVVTIETQDAIIAVKSHYVSGAGELSEVASVFLILLESDGHRVSVDGWYGRHDGNEYVVIFKFYLDGQIQEASWRYDPQDGSVTPLDIWAREMLLWY